MYMYSNLQRVIHEYQGGQSRDKNKLLCTSIWTEPVSKSDISFLKLNEISQGKEHIPRNGTL